MTGELICSSCHRPYPLEQYAVRCACGAHLELSGVSAMAVEDVELADHTLWRYRRGLGFAPHRLRADFGEGLTPLVARTWQGADVRLKLDYLFPSGSFKDRGWALFANYAVGIGARRVHEDSSGNAGAALAAYAAAAGLQCRIFVPAHASSAKIRQIQIHGAQVERVAGERARVASVAAEYQESGSLYLSHNWHPVFIEGMKTLAFEIWEQLGFQTPGAILVPAGYGSALLGLDRGFRTLLAGGSIRRRPRLIACQAANCAVLHEAVLSAQGHPTDPPREPAHTVAEGIACSEPIRLQAMVSAVLESGGETVAVEEETITQAQQALARCGVFVEPTSAVVAAAASKLIHDGRWPAGGDVVLVLTGSGLKTPA